MTTNSKYLFREIKTGYENLANAIVAQAVDDYRRLLRGKRVPDKVTKKKCEKFFLSKWFESLTQVDGKKILKRLQKEYEDERKANTTDTQSD
jgi:hypothetical protein